MENLIPLVGLIVFILIAFLLSSNKKAIKWRTVFSGIFLQVLFALFILKTEVGMTLFQSAKDSFSLFLGYTKVGSSFVFGSLADASSVGFIFATMVLPTIIFFSSVMSVLYHLGIMQKVVEITAFLVRKTMGTSGSESLAAAANIFAGQTEAPLVVKPFLNKMTQSELMALMTGGMATLAGGVLAAYAGMGIDAGHLLAASFMSAPAALVCAKLIVPEIEVSSTKDVSKIQSDEQYANVIDAAASGAIEGLKLALNVGAMLLAFIALIAMVNGMLGYFGSLFGYPNLSFELLLGYLFSPFAFLMGISLDECIKVGELLGQKTVLNELVAYSALREMLGSLSNRSVTITTYALCGFANFSSIAIQIGGIGTLAPSRRKDLATLGIKSLIAGTLACFMTASIAALLI